MKGILNKLTPENFDRLLQQVLDIVTDAEILHSTITLVFENAVAQPTFAFMYAQLCDRLSKVSGLLCSCFHQEQIVVSVHLIISFQESKHACKGMLTSEVRIHRQEYTCPAQTQNAVTRAQGLPEFPPAEGEARPMTFKRVLLNTCQEEFEGAQEAREVT